MNQKRKSILIIFLFLITSITSLYSQNFKGKLVDSDDNPIIGATVLVKDGNQGVACNDSGEFQFILVAGVHKIEYRSLGYETYTETITIIDGKVLYRKITLIEKPVSLDEVIISGKENPANEIVQLAIDKAAYHQNIVKQYEAECYIKGEAELTKISKLINRVSSLNGVKLSDLQGNLFIQESYNTINFEAPDIYEQKVEAFNSSAPDFVNDNMKMRLATSSIYLPRFAGLISPLHPNAFTYYKYKYEGYTEENGEIINKIRVIPRLNDPELLRGCLYIAEGSWDIRFVELEGKVFGIEQHFVITFDEIEDTLYMPVTFSVHVLGKMMGFEGYFNYFSSMKYRDLVMNDSVQATIKLVKKKKRELEIKFDDGYTIEMAPEAKKRDSIYWALVRKTPQSEREIESFLLKDSLQYHLDSLHKANIKPDFRVQDIFIGGSVGGKLSDVQFKYGGIAGVLRDYNLVDGFGLGQKLELITRIDKGNTLYITPEVYYTTARKNMVWSVAVDLDYSPMRLGHLHFSAGDILSNFNPEGANRFDNATSSLFWGDNVTMLYRKRFFKVKNGIEIAKGLRFSSQIKLAERVPVNNNTEYSIFGGKSNVKENMVSSDYRDLLSYTFGLEYTPRHYYYIRDGRKRYLYADSPTFKLNFSEGISSIRDDNTKYRRVEAEISQVIKTDQFSSIRYEINGGAFLGNNEKMNLADYRHFNTYDDMWFISKLPYSSFMLLDTYESSTNDFWIYSHVNYYSKYILLKRIPFLQGKLFNEALHARYLYTPEKKNYTEVGYSIDYLNALSFGVHCSFNKLRYEAFGFRLSLNLDVFKAD